MTTKPRHGVTIRSTLTGLVLVASISIISPWAILIVKGSQLTSNAIPIIAVFLLFATVVIAQPVLRLLSHRLAFSRAELLTVYVMMLTGSVVVTTGLTGSFLSVISGAIYYATPENKWDDLFVPYLSSWLTPVDTEAVRLFYEGLPHGMDIPWYAWIRPLATWISFLLMFYAVLFCLSVLLRGQWVDNERLVFPLTHVPMAIVEGEDENHSLIGRFCRNRIMWLGFALPLVLHSWNSLGNYTHLLETIPLADSFTLTPMIGGIPFRLNFPALGLAYFMPLNVAFSVWFFFVIGQLEQIAMALVGIQIGTGDVWTSGGGRAIILSYQQSGAMMVFVLILLWAARSHIIGLWQQAISGQSDERRGEVLSPQFAFSGLGLGMAFMIAWLTLTGLNFYVSTLLVCGALCAFVGLSRIVAEAGLPSAQTPMVPQAFITRGFGPEVLGLNNMTNLALSTVWMGETASNMMNAALHSLRLSSGKGRYQQFRGIPLAIALAICVGLAGSIWFTMKTAYAYGGINLHSWYYSGAPQWPFRYMAAIYNAPEPFLSRLGFTALGGSIMSFLLYMRYRFVWWPLHPIGFPVASTFQITHYLWFSIFLAWLLKGTLLRYGGVRLYRLLRPLFLGLVLGEFTAACIWVVVDGYYGFEGNIIYNF